MNNQQNSSGENQKGRQATMSNGEEKQTGTTPEKKQGGYSSAPEQQQTQQEQEEMHSERNLHDLDADKEQPKPQEADKQINKDNKVAEYARTAPKPGQA